MWLHLSNDIVSSCNLRCQKAVLKWSVPNVWCILACVLSYWAVDHITRTLQTLVGMPLYICDSNCQINPISYRKVEIAADVPSEMCIKILLAWGHNLVVEGGIEEAAWVLCKLESKMSRSYLPWSGSAHCSIISRAWFVVKPDRVRLYFWINHREVNSINWGLNNPDRVKAPTPENIASTDNFT